MLARTNAVKGASKGASARGKEAAALANRGSPAGLVAEIGSFSETQNEVFAEMLAEMDSRIDEITTRMDRLLAQHC